MWEISAASIFDAIKTASPKVSTAVLTATSLIFFLPTDLLSHIGLSTLRDDYRLYLGLAFILSASLVAVHAVFALRPLIASQWEKYRYRSKMFQSLRALSAQEKEFLRPYIDNDQATRNARVDDGVANGLYAKQILFRAANVGVALQFPYNLQPIPQRLLSGIGGCWTTHPPPKTALNSCAIGSASAVVPPEILT